MLPVLLSIGDWPVSSFGVFLVLGFLVGMFLVWRLARAWDLDEEKVLDLTLLTFLGAILGARIYFAIENLPVFMASPFNLILINKVPGLSFWGGILGGWLTLHYFAKRKRLDFWQLADIAFVGLLGGLILSSFGCFLGGCSIGSQTDSIFGVSMVGAVAKRWPVQIIEAVLLILGLLKIWSKATHFHQRGKIAALGFLYVGFITMVLDPLRQDHSGRMFSLIFILLGSTIYYRVTKQNPLTHLKQVKRFLVQFVIDAETRKRVVQNLSKSCYNQKTIIGWKLRSLKKNSGGIKRLLRRLNVKFTQENP